MRHFKGVWPSEYKTIIIENIKFQGGQFARWIHQQYPQNACVLSIEIKKFFMDEWTGMGDPVQIQALKSALASTLPVVKSALEDM